MSEIVIELIVTPQGGELFIPSLDRVEKARARSQARSQALLKVAAEIERAIENPPKDSDPDELATLRQEKLDEAAAITAEADTMVAANLEIRDTYKNALTTVTYPFRPYTDGEKTDALAEATTYDTGAPKLDPNKYQRKLVSVCTGLSEAEIKGFSPARAEALIREVIDRSEPDPARLDFLF